MVLNTPQWRKSSRSTDNGGACVEIAVWRKASHSGDNGGNCVEVAVLSLTGDADRGDRA
ncbi:DUF397 domain-containing protein [Actinoallomurus sp. NPDC050550]|uniref:DUF397 domain-containing protein n=1 Tax=Actinoallomurus sp. NPDC050550 TaxID=3154937 RepID=UPI0033FF7BB9